jgi:hypothetical protein
MPSLSSSDSVEDQIVNALSRAMDEAVYMLSTGMRGPSTPRLKHHQRYVNRDREATHLRLRHDYFNDDCVYPPTYFRWRYRMW